MSADQQQGQPVKLGALEQVEKVWKKIEQLTKAIAELAGEFRAGIARADRERNTLALGLEARDEAIEKLQAQIEPLVVTPEIEAQRLDILAKRLATHLAPDLAAGQIANAKRLDKLEAALADTSKKTPENFGATFDKLESRLAALERARK